MALEQVLQVMHCLKVGVIKYSMPDHAHFDIHLSFFPCHKLCLSMWRYQQPGFALRLLCELQKQQQCSLHCDALLQTEGEREGNWDRRREGIKHQVKLIHKSQAVRFSQDLPKSRCIAATTTDVHAVCGCIR